MRFKLDETIYTIKPQAYTASFGDSKCNVLVWYREDLFESIILGNYFLQDFVTQFNYETGQIKFGLNVNAIGAASIEVPKVTEEDHTGLIISIVVICSILVGIVLCLVAVCLIKRRRRRAKTREADTIAYGPAHK